MMSYIWVYKLQTTFMELDFEADKLSWIEGNDGWTVTKIKLN